MLIIGWVLINITELFLHTGDGRLFEVGANLRFGA